MESISTVKIYKTTVTEAYMMSEQKKRFSLSPWGDNTVYYKGEDDGGRDYILPDEYTVGMSSSESMEFYRRDNDAHVRLTTYRGGPALADVYAGGKPIILKLARGK